MSRKKMWNDESQEILQENLHTKTLKELSKLLNLSVTTVRKHRIETLKKQVVHKERPPANYSNRSPYGIAIPGLNNLQQ